MTGLTTVASRPCWEKLRFASIAPHNLLWRSGSRNVSARGLHCWRHITKTQLPVSSAAACRQAWSTDVADKSESTRGT